MNGWMAESMGGTLTFDSSTQHFNNILIFQYKIFNLLYFPKQSKTKFYAMSCRCIPSLTIPFFLTERHSIFNDSVMLVAALFHFN